MISLYTRWFHRWALLAGWAAGMAYGTIQAWRTPGQAEAHFGASTAPVFGHITYIAITALVVNLAVATALTLLFRAMKLPNGHDETQPGQYTAEPKGAPPPEPARLRPLVPRRPRPTPHALPKDAPKPPGPVARDGHQPPRHRRSQAGSA